MMAEIVVSVKIDTSSYGDLCHVCQHTNIDIQRCETETILLL